MKLDIYSHHFSVNTDSEFEKDVCKRFAARFAEYSYRVPGFKGVKKMVRLFAAANKSRNQYRFHIHCLSDFKNTCRFAGIDETKITQNTYELYDPPFIEYDLNPALQPREMQPMCIEFIHAPGAIKQVALQTGKGKSIRKSSPVLTPAGWVPIGQLSVGDAVCAPDGTVTKVNGVYPQGKLPLYKVTFRDGRFVHACKDHLWKVYYVNTQPHKRWRIVNTLEMLRLISMPNPRVYVPLMEPWAGIDYKLPIDPYLLGTLLGDGCLTRPSALTFTSPDEHILDLVRNKLNLYNYELRYASRYDYRIVRKSMDKPMLLHGLLDEIGLLGKTALNKFIPQNYLDAKAEDRWSLLQGLIDTDGTVGKEGHITYFTSSFTLAKNVQYLVRSLGGMCKISKKIPFYTLNGEKKQGEDSYVLHIRVTDPKRVCTLPKKQDRIPEEYQYNDLKLQVTSIELDGEDEAVCIAVDHPDKLFITKDFTVTHNTFTALYALAKLNLRIAVVVKKGYIHRWFSDLLGEDSLMRLDPSELLVVRGLSHLSEIITQAVAGEFDQNIKVIMVSTNVMDAYYNHYDENDGDMTAFGGMAPEALWAVLGVGGRILDEVHQLLHMNFRMDLYTHVTKAVYLSATLIASTPLIELIYKTMFPPHTRAKTGDYDRYINMTCLYYGLQDERIKWTRFGSPDYSQAAFEESIMKNKRVCNGYVGWLAELINRYYISLPDRDELQKGMIFCGTIEFCTILSEYMNKEFPNLDTRRFIGYDPYTNVTDGQFIITTHGSLGTAHDIPNLRICIKAIGMGKQDANLQNAGRLRKLKNYPDITPEYYYLTCRDIPQHMKYHKTMEELFVPRVLKFRALETDFRL